MRLGVFHLVVVQKGRCSILPTILGGQNFSSLLRTDENQAQEVNLLPRPCPSFGRRKPPYPCGEESMPPVVQGTDVNFSEEVFVETIARQECDGTTDVESYKYAYTTTVTVSKEDGSLLPDFVGFPKGDRTSLNIRLNCERYSSGFCPPDLRRRESERF